MKKHLILLFVPALCWGQITGMGTGGLESPTRTHSEQELIGGEHVPLIYTWGDTLMGNGAAVTSSWRQIGYVAEADVSSRVVSKYNPEYFTLAAAYEGYATGAGAADSVGIGAMRFEMAIDTTTVDSTKYPMWLADSTNFFIADGNYNHSLYGQWMFEDFRGTLAQYASGKVWSYPLRILFGGYIRFVSTPAVMSDSTRRTLYLIAEH